MKKMIKIHYGVICRQNRLEKANEVRKKKLSFCFVPTQSVIENSKKLAKFFKKLKKYNFGGIPSQNWLEKAQREKIKIIVPFHSYPTRKRKFKKNSKKIL